MLGNVYKSRHLGTSVSTAPPRALVQEGNHLANDTFCKRLRPPTKPIPSLKPDRVAYAQPPTLARDACVRLGVLRFPSLNRQRIRRALSKPTSPARPGHRGEKPNRHSPRPANGTRRHQRTMLF